MSRGSYLFPDPGLGAWNGALISMLLGVVNLYKLEGGEPSSTKLYSVLLVAGGVGAYIGNWLGKYNQTKLQQAGESPFRPFVNGLRGAFSGCLASGFATIFASQYMHTLDFVMCFLVIV